MEFTFPLINSKYIEGKGISNDWSLLHIFPFLLIYSQPQCFRTKYLTVKLWFLEPSNFLLSYQLKTCSGIEKILDDYWVERCLEFKHNYSKEVAFEALQKVLIDFAPIWKNNVHVLTNRPKSTVFDISKVILKDGRCWW